MGSAGAGALGSPLGAGSPGVVVSSGAEGCSAPPRSPLFPPRCPRRGRERSLSRSSRRGSEPSCSDVPSVPCSGDGLLGVAVGVGVAVGGGAGGGDGVGDSAGVGAELVDGAGTVASGVPGCGLRAAKGPKPTAPAPTSDPSITTERPATIVAVRERGARCSCSGLSRTPVIRRRISTTPMLIQNPPVFPVSSRLAAFRARADVDFASTWDRAHGADACSTCFPSAAATATSAQPSGRSAHRW